MKFEDVDARMAELQSFDTPSITNVVATYPTKPDSCLGLYDPWLINWYTDQSIKCMYPDMGPRAGYAVTAVFGLPDHKYTRLGLSDVYKALAEAPKPTILVIKQDMPKKYKKKNGLSGGIMTTTFKALGCVGCISDGPSRDINEIRPMDFQYLLSGVCAGHGEFSVKAVNIPVSVSGMDIAPGEVIHMDENGAVKFPASSIDDVIGLSRKLIEAEERRIAKINNATTVEEVLAAAAGFEDKD